MSDLSETFQREVKEIFLELIGEDEQYPYGDDIVEFQLNMTQEMARIDAQNTLRAELRKKVADL